MESSQAGNLSIPAGKSPLVQLAAARHRGGISSLPATYLYLKQLDKAEKVFTKANTMAPNQPDININLGIVYLRKKNYNKAIKRFERALKINPSSASAYFHLGLTYKRKGKTNKAKESFEKAIELNPEYRKKIISLLSK